MANEAAKRISASNLRILAFLRTGFLISNAVYLSYLFLYRNSVSRRSIIGYGMTESIALYIWAHLRSASMPRYEGGKLVSAGEDLSKPGVTQYLLDVLYINFAVRILGALVWRGFSWLYALIPAYIVYSVVTQVVLPQLSAANAGARGDGPAQPALSKRQQKLQERYGTQPGQRVQRVRQR